MKTNLDFISPEELKDFELQLLQKVAAMITGSKIDPPDEILTSSEVKRILKISESTLEVYRRNGIIKFHRLGDGERGKILYRREDIENMVHRKNAFLFNYFKHVMTIFYFFVLTQKKSRLQKKC